MDDPPVRLVAIDRDTWRDAVAVRVSPDRLRFVAGHEPVALVILAKAYVRPGDLDWEPLALVRGTAVVAVLALAHAPAHTELLHLAVDVTQQGQGLGTAAVELAVAHVRGTRPGCREMRLTVHPENGPAQRLYRAAGFVPTGGTRDDEPVWSLDLTRDAGPPPPRPR